MNTQFGKKHIFTDRSGSSEIGLSAGVGETLGVDSQLFLNNTNDVSVSDTNGSLVSAGGAYFSGSIRADNFIGNLIGASTGEVDIQGPTANTNYNTLVTLNTAGSSVLYASTALQINPSTGNVNARKFQSFNAVIAQGTIDTLIVENGADISLVGTGGGSIISAGGASFQKGVRAQLFVGPLLGAADQLDLDVPSESMNYRSLWTKDTSGNSTIYAGTGLTFNPILGNMNVPSLGSTESSTSRSLITTGSIANASLFFANITVATIATLNLSGINASNASITSSTFPGANITNAQITNSTTTRSLITGGTITNLNNSAATVTNLLTTNASISAATITNLLTTNSTLTNSTITSGTIGSLRLPIISRILGTNSSGIVIPNGSQSLGIYVPKGWGSNWKTALTNTGSTLASISFIGDSITQGYDSSNFTTKSYVSLVRTTLQSTYGNGGSGYQSSRWSEYDGSYTSTQTKVASTGTWSVSNPGSGPANYSRFSNNNGATMTFSYVQGTKITVYYALATNGGTFTVSIDGGTAVSTNSNSGSAGIGTYTVSGLSNTTHSVVITCTSASTLVYTLIFGVRGYHTSGVTCDNFGISARTSGGFLANPSVIYGNQIDWSGGSSFPCNLFVYALNVNDAHNLTNAATSAEVYMTNVLSVIKRIRDYSGYTGLGNVDILFFMPHIGQWQLTGPEYYSMCRNLESACISLNCAYINMAAIYKNSWNYANSQNLWSDGHTGTGASGTDEVHPGDTGHQLYANALLSVINDISDT